MPTPLNKKTPLWQTLTTEATLADIHRQLCQGVRPAVLARKVQGSDPPLFAGRTVRQVRDWFIRYHRNVIQPEGTRSQLDAAPASRRGALVRRLDVIADLEDVAVKMGAHLDRLLAYERAQASGPGDAGKGTPPPRRLLAKVDRFARDYRTTLVMLARLYRETGLLRPAPNKRESALATAMAGRPPFEFTQDDIDRFERASRTEGMTGETIEPASSGDRGGDDRGGDDPGSDDPGGRDP